MNQMLEEAVWKAMEARARAYCPYSSYAVGACIIYQSEGELHIQAGCNVENVSFGLSNCAERTAIFTAVAAHGKLQIELAVVATQDGGTPCGACLQVIAEFAAHSCQVVCVNDAGDRRQFTLDELMPHAFTSKALEKGL